MKKFLVTFTAIIAINNTFKSQNKPGDYTMNLLANVKAPQTSDFIRYGNLPVNKFSGEPNLQIPLFNLKSSQVGDNISVSLGYNFSGLIPNKRPDIVGLNWFLNVGGVISRQVNTIPDDQKGESNVNGPAHGMNKDGLIVGLRNKMNCLPFHDNVGIFNLSSQTGFFSSGELDYKLKGCDQYTAYDGDADIFTFNFNGYSGKFFLGNDNQIKIISEDAKGFKIDITNLTTQPLSQNCNPLSSEIKITDDKGNEYYFGGESKNLEYNINLSHNDATSAESIAGLPVINSWYLRQIKYSNGESVYFNYKDDTSLTNLNFCNSEFFQHYNSNTYRQFLIYNENIVQDLSCVSPPNSWDPNAVYNCLGVGGTSDKRYSLTKKAILEKITTDNFSIVFNYSEQPYVFNKNNYNFSTYKNIKNPQLNSTVLYDKNMSEINKFDFSYVLLGGTVSSNSFPRLFLDTVTEKEKRPYSFTYYVGSGENLPKPATKQIDHWGYYNGKSVNENQNYMIPSQTIASNGDYTFTSNNRDTDFSYAIKGVLKEVIYPTSGKTTFEFEVNNYTKRIERRSASAFLPTLYNVNGTGAGIRVKSITDTDENNNAYKKEYTYEDGILLTWPRYTMWVNNNFTSSGWLRSASINSNVLESSVINYGKVTESTSNKGKIISEYSNYLTNPDIADYNVILNPGNPLSTSTNIELAKNYVGLFNNDISNERGKLLTESIYDNNNLLLKKMKFVYNQDPNRFNQFSSVIHLSGPAAQANKRYYYQNNLTKKETYDYFLENGQIREILTSENFNYSVTPDIQLIKRQTIFPDGKVNEVSTNYAYQDNNTLLISKNMLSIPIESTVISKENINAAAETIMSHTKGVYPPSLPTTQTGSLALPISSLSYDLLNSTPLTEVTYDKYDAKGNIQQYTTKYGISTTIIWGYNNTQPIAKIEGAKLSDITPTLITSIVNASNDDNSPPQGVTPDQTEQNLILALDTFMRNSTLSGYEITTYTYNPLIGVTSITPPSGIREVYIYDTANRLKEIRQDSKTGNILKEFKYNYKN